MTRRYKIGLLLVCVAICVAYWAIDRVDRFYYDFGVELTYKGRAVAIKRTIACIRSHRAPATGRSQEAVAERLDDGSGIIVIIPSLCEAETWPLSPHYVPQIFWTENAESHDLLEGYFSEELLRSGKGRITLVSVFAKRSSVWAFGRDKSDFTLLAGDPSNDLTRQYNGSGIEYFGLLARVIQPEQWEQVPEISNALSQSTTDGNLPLNPYLPFNKSFPLITHWVEILGGAPQVSVRTENRDALDAIVPLRWEGAEFQPDESLRGLALLYPADRVRPDNMEVSDRNSPGITRIIAAADATGSTSPKWPMSFDSAHCKAADSNLCYSSHSRRVVEIQLISFFLVQP